MEKRLRNVERHNEIGRGLGQAAAIFHALAEEAQPTCPNPCPTAWEEGDTQGCAGFFDPACSCFESAIEYRQLKRLAWGISGVLVETLRPESGPPASPEVGWERVTKNLQGFAPHWVQSGAPKDASDRDRVEYPGLDTEAGKKLRRQAEDRLRKDKSFFKRVCSLLN